MAETIPAAHVRPGDAVYRHGVGFRRVYEVSAVTSNETVFFTLHGEVRQLHMRTLVSVIRNGDCGDD